MNKIIATYFLLIIAIYGGISVEVAVVIYLIILFLFLLGGYKDMLKLTFLIYPMMFIIKIPDHTNPFFIIFPDVVALLSIFSYSLATLNKDLTPKNKNVTICLLILMILNFKILFLHTLSLEAIPLIFRQYIMPIIFATIFLNASESDENLVSVASMVSLLSYSFVSIVSLLNYFSLITVPPVFEEVYPWVNYLRSFEENVNHGRSLFGSDLIMRLNPMLGGALGSSAGILMTLSMIALFNVDNGIHYSFKILLSLVLALAAILTISNSIILPIIIWVVLYSYLNVGKIIIIPSLILVFIIVNTVQFIGISIIDYFYESFIINIYDAINGVSINSFLFGNGPKFTSNFYVNNTVEYSGDIGIFRVLMESGFIVFTVFLLILFMIVKKYFEYGNKSILNKKFPYILLFFVMIFSIHTNLIFTAPFYPLFGLCVAGLFSLKKSSIKKSLSISN
jgi:hypothetical protein